MKKAYRIAQELLKDRLKDVDPEAYRELKDIKEADVIVIGGIYDFIQNVLSMAGTPHILIDPTGLDHAELRPDQVIFINCPGKLSPLGLRKLKTFVSSGGFLFTTDWALKYVLEEAFPGYVRYNEKPTRDEVVRVEILDTDDPFLKSLLGPKDDPQWWLEGSSYPIQILDKDKVKVLVTSKEIEKKYGEAPVFITFDYGEGKIYHMISHFYLQRSETRTKRQKLSADKYFAEKEIAFSAMPKYEELGLKNASLGDVESAFTSSAMMSKIMYDKKMQLKKIKMEKKKDGKEKK